MNILACGSDASLSIHIHQYTAKPSMILHGRSSTKSFYLNMSLKSGGCGALPDFHHTAPVVVILPSRPHTCTYRSIRSRYPILDPGVSYFMVVVWWSHSASQSVSQSTCLKRSSLTLFTPFGWCDPPYRWWWGRRKRERSLVWRISWVCNEPRRSVFFGIQCAKITTSHTVAIYTQCCFCCCAAFCKHFSVD